MKHPIGTLCYNNLTQHHYDFIVFIIIILLLCIYIYIYTCMHVHACMHIFMFHAGVLHICPEAEMCSFVSGTEH
jgi:hypothetical protein